MHSVSPVRIRTEDGVRNPMTTTCFEDAYNNQKSKKRVQIGSSTFFKEKEQALARGTAKKIVNTELAKTQRQICRKKKPEFTTKKTDEYDKIPTKDVPAQMKRPPMRPTAIRAPVGTSIKPPTAASCSTCVESRSRSRSNSARSPEVRAPAKQVGPTCNKGQQQNNREDTSYLETETSQDNISDTSCSFNSRDSHPSRRVSSLSPIRPVWNECDSHMTLTGAYLNPNVTYTMGSRSRSFDSSVRDLCNHHRVAAHVQDAFQTLPEHPHHPSVMHISPTAMFNRESLGKKLTTTEETAAAIAEQLDMLKDYLISNRGQLMNGHIVGHIEHERNRLIQSLELFMMSNRDLRDTIHAMNSPACMSNIKLMEENQMLVDKVDALEIEKNKYKNMLMELETNIFHTGHTNEALNFENNALSNLKCSLEDNRAHLRRQLIVKESDINRLNVKVKELHKKLEKANSEISLLKAGIRTTNSSSSSSKIQPLSQPTTMANKKAHNTNIYNHSKGAKLVKQYFNLEDILTDQQKTRLYIDKLNTQITERDNAIKHLNCELDKKAAIEQEKRQQQQQLLRDQPKSSCIQNGSESDDRSTTVTSNLSDQKLTRQERHEAEKLRKENDRLKNHIQVRDEKLKNAESKIKNLEKKLNSGTAANRAMSQTSENNRASHKASRNQSEPRRSNQGSSSEDATNNFPIYNSQNENNHNHKASENDSIQEEMDMSKTNTIQRTKNFSEQELNNVRSRLQERLNELEPLPELLKNTELKLHEALIKLKNVEIEGLEHKRAVNQLKYELESAHVTNSNLMGKLKETTNMKLDQAASNSSKLTETFELKQMEDATKLKLLENLRANKLEPIEKKIQLLEEENREMNRQIMSKEEMIRELSTKLAMKANEASSYSRQLEMAISDAKVKEQQLKEKATLKERTWSGKCSELETKLSSLQFSTKSDKRDKEELASDYIMQIKDLKARLDQATTTNKQMQDYVNFLKNSYMSYFNDNSLDSYDFGGGASSFGYGLKGHNNLF